MQFTETTQSSAPAVVVLPPKLESDSAHENTLLPATAAEPSTLRITVRDAASDADLLHPAAEQALRQAGSPEGFISGSARSEREHGAVARGAHHREARCVRPDAGCRTRRRDAPRAPLA